MSPLLPLLVLAVGAPVSRLAMAALAAAEMPGPLNPVLALALFPVPGPAEAEGALWSRSEDDDCAAFLASMPPPCAEDEEEAACMPCLSPPPPPPPPPLMLRPASRAEAGYTPAAP